MIKDINIDSLRNSIKAFLDLKEEMVDEKYCTLDGFRDRMGRYGVRQEQAEAFWPYLKAFRRMSSQLLPFTPIGIRYVLTRDILRELHLCDQGLPKTLNAGKKITEALSDEAEAIYSSRLEGAVTTELVARNILRKNLPPQSKDERMIVNNYHARQFIRKKSDSLLTPEFICEIHKKVTEGTLEDEKLSGSFRTSDDVVVRNILTQEDIYYPPDALEIPSLVQALCDLANRDRKEELAGSFVHPLIIGIALHFLIGYIHPFYDGNGRTARMLFYWYVLSRGYRLFDYMPISRIITQSPGQYKKAYIETEDVEDGEDLDLTYFLVYNIRCIRKAREKLIEYLHNERERVGKADGLIADLPNLNKRQRQILRYILENKNEEFRIREIADKFSVAYQTARTDLMSLEDCKYLWKRREGKTQYYSMDKAWLDSINLSAIGVR